MSHSSPQSGFTSGPQVQLTRSGNFGNDEWGLYIKTGREIVQNVDPATEKIGRMRARIIDVAEDRGFEPLRALTQPAFQASAIGH